jgi:C1A family cysteine protease
MKRNYGWHPSKPDIRNHKYKAPKIFGIINQSLPNVVDLRSIMSPIEDQGQTNSCTAHALVAMFQALEIKNKRDYNDYSRLFVYANERDIEGNLDSDCGGCLHDGIQGIKNNGICFESFWPFDTSKITVKPNGNAYNNAKHNLMSEYQSLDTLYDMKHCLSQGFPFVLGFTVYDYFESDAMAETGILNMPGPDENTVGGHAICCIGYDDNKQQALMRNSWSSSWGPFGGYFWMSYEYLSSELCSDKWTVR